MFQRNDLWGAFIAGAFLLLWALIAQGCANIQDCTTDHCSGPLNILVAEELIPEGGSVELLVNNKALHCSEDHYTKHECYVGGENYGVRNAVYFEVKSLPKTITIRILDSDGERVDSFDEKPAYETYNRGSCSYECHRNATVVIGDVDGWE